MRCLASDSLTLRSRFELPSCYTVDMSPPGTKQQIVEHDQKRFVEIFHGLWDEKTSSLRGSAHALTLVSAFRDPMLSGDSPADRLRAILALTGNANEFPGGHFNQTVLSLHVREGDTPLGAGDRGFRPELQDSLRYYPGKDGKRPPLFPGSSNQIGHFLTAAHIAFYIRTRDNYYDELARARAKMEAAMNPFVLALLRHEEMAAGVSSADVQLGVWEVEKEGLMHIMIGHEMITDEYRVFDNPKLNSFAHAVHGGARASWSDSINFLNDRLDLITVDDRPSNYGNSYQDLLLTWVGYLFGAHVAAGRFSSRNEAAAWLELMLMERDLGAIPPTHPFYRDAKRMQYMLEQFRRIQDKKKVESPAPQ